MGTMIEIGRYALESFEVLFALAATGLLGIGLIHARQAEASRRDPAGEAAAREG
ncbi:hypothetical protein [Longimicrobium sp.]|uniref:hypothetical protein n=1 Tax=Longimicrobium sp. TaxID=2029185 RepID=UPI002C33807C|nr:hypothetical protein [Longimicrobium sp.]HSU13849.1 hypothetical protein [Longimicrobium sp.]